MKQKVTAFILRPTPTGQPEILLHEFLTPPPLPLRLPGGGVEPGETPEQALHRELKEETGLTNLKIHRKLGVQSYYKPYLQSQVERHDYLLWASADLPDSWQYLVRGNGEDAGEMYGFRWFRPSSPTNIDQEHRPFLTPDYIPELFNPSPSPINSIKK